MVFKQFCWFLNWKKNQTIRFVATHGQTIIELLGACAVEFFLSNSSEMQTQTIR